MSDLRTTYFNNDRSKYLPVYPLSGVAMGFSSISGSSFSNTGTLLFAVGFSLKPSVLQIASVGTAKFELHFDFTFFCPAA